MNAAEISTIAAAGNVRYCHLEFTDVVGLAKAVTVPITDVPAILNAGRWFDGASIQGFAREMESDMYLRPDPATFAEIPWEPTRARIVCDVVRPDGTPFEGDPRGRLKDAIRHAARLGYRYEVSPEIEFFLLHPDALDHGPIRPFDRGSYFDLQSAEVTPFWSALTDALAALGVAVDACHHEVADGQHEIDLGMQDALAAADAIMACKQAIKATAAQHRLLASFLPKPFTGVNGSGMHIHQRLRRRDGDTNVFAEPEQRDGSVSTSGRQFIAGLLEHAGGFSAIVSPLVNSYKRLIPNYEAPVEINWGYHNQDMLVRVPRPSDASVSDLRIEIRSPDPSCNPYLALAVLLRAGLDGMERRLECPSPDRRLARSIQPDAGRHLLPQSLGEALRAMAADALVADALGATIFEQIIEAKTREWDSYREEVSAWEHRRYLALY